MYWQVWHEGFWSPVCAKGFGKAEAQVTCRQLGYRNESFAGEGPDLGVGPFWLEGVACRGNEMRLEGCLGTQWRSTSCPAGAAAAVSCCVCLFEDGARTKTGTKSAVQLKFDKSE